MYNENFYSLRLRKDRQNANAMRNMASSERPLTSDLPKNPGTYFDVFSLSLPVVAMENKPITQNPRVS